MATPRLVETKDTAQHSETKGAEATHVAAAHVVTQCARSAMLAGVFNNIPTPESFLIPDGHCVDVRQLPNRCLV